MHNGDGMHTIKTGPKQSDSNVEKRSNKKWILVIRNKMLIKDQWQPHNSATIRMLKRL